MINSPLINWTKRIIEDVNLNSLCYICSNSKTKCNYCRQGAFFEYDVTKWDTIPALEYAAYKSCKNVNTYLNMSDLLNLGLEI